MEKLETDMRIGIIEFGNQIDKYLMDTEEFKPILIHYHNNAKKRYYIFLYEFEKSFCKKLVFYYFDTGVVNVFELK